MDFKDFVRKALAVPFLTKGRSYDGWDCWGLVFCCYRDVRGIQLPSYADDYERSGDTHQARQELQQLIDRESPAWRQIVHAQQFDLAVFKIADIRSHIGVMVDRVNCLHAEFKIGTVIEPVNSLMWEKRIEGIYQYVRPG